jgi:hypothetical protein
VCPNKAERRQLKKKKSVQFEGGWKTTGVGGWKRKREREREREKEGKTPSEIFNEFDKTVVTLKEKTPKDQQHQ